jgi:hypothetical protein
MLRVADEVGNHREILFERTGDEFLDFGGRGAGVIGCGPSPSGTKAPGGG